MSTRTSKRIPESWKPPLNPSATGARAWVSIPAVLALAAGEFPGVRGAVLCATERAAISAASDAVTVANVC